MLEQAFSKLQSLAIGVVKPLYGLLFTVLCSEAAKLIMCSKAPVHPRREPFMLPLFRLKTHYWGEKTNKTKASERAAGSLSLQAPVLEVLFGC